MRAHAFTLAVLLFFLLATGFMLNPMIAPLPDQVRDWGDPLENTWVLAWDAHQLTTDPLSLYHANIFYPYSNALAFSESQLASAVLALPLNFAAGNPALAYNFVFFFAFAFSAFTTYLLTYDLTRNRWGALLALALMGADYTVRPMPYAPIQTGAAVPSTYRWLAQQRPGNVLELPVDVGQVEPITRSMYFSAYHWHPLLLGYGSFAPQTNVDLINLVNSSLNPVTARLLNLLREFDVRYLVMHSGEYPKTQWQQLEPSLNQSDGLQRIYVGESDYVYGVLGDASPHRLSFNALPPSFAQVGQSYLAYLTIQHLRHYLIVTGDHAPHEVAVVWNKNGAPVMTQTFRVTLPEVLHARAEGVPLNLTMPREAGTYQLAWRLDSKPLTAIDGNAQVLVQADAREKISAAPIELLSTTLNTREVSAGGEIILTLFWRRVRAVPENYRVVVRLIDAQGKVWTQIARQPELDSYPTRLWRDGELVADGYAVPVPNEVSVGAFHLLLQLAR